MKRKVLILIIIVTLAVIWGHSCMPPEVSSEESGWVMTLIRPVLGVFVGPENVTMFLVRKLGHFTEFFVFGAELMTLFWQRSFGQTKLSQKREMFLPGIFERAGWLSAVCCAFLTAFIDETIQIFSGRGPMIQDVWLDTAGAAAGAAVLWVVLRLLASRKK